MKNVPLKDPFPHSFDNGCSARPLKRKSQNKDFKTERETEKQKERERKREEERGRERKREEERGREKEKKREKGKRVFQGLKNR